MVRTPALSILFEKSVDDSRLTQCDSYYQLPQIVECFVDRANKEVPTGFLVKPWTLNRAVTLQHMGKKQAIFYYEDIEFDIVACLDTVVEISRRVQDEQEAS